MKYSSVPVQYQKKSSNNIKDGLLLSLSEQEKKRVSFISSKKAKKLQKESLYTNTVLKTMKCNLSDTGTYLRTSGLEQAKKSYLHSKDKVKKLMKKNYNSNSNYKDDQENLINISNGLQKRKKINDKILSAKKFEKNSNLKSRKTSSKHKKKSLSTIDNPVNYGTKKRMPYPRIPAKRKRSSKKEYSDNKNYVSKKTMTNLSQSQSSNNLTVFHQKKVNPSLNASTKVKNTYSSGFNKSKAFLIPSENLINFRKRKGISSKLTKPMIMNSNEKNNYNAEKGMMKYRKVNQSLQNMKNSYSSKVIFWKKN